MLKYSFDNGGSFFKELRKKVELHFSSNQIHPAGNRRLIMKGAVQVLVALSLYVVLVFFTPPGWISIPLCVMLGLNLAVIGFNIMHEGGHQCFSKYEWVNKISAYFLNMLGGSAYFWKIKHNINHHTYTNVEGMDSDIDVKPFMRLHEEQPRHRYHRFQHIYCIALYSISYLAWIFYEDFQKYFSGRVSANSEKKRLPLIEHLIFWFSKIMYVSAYMIIPIIMVGFLSWMVGFLVVTFVCGLAISIVFQLAHVVEGTQFYVATDNQERSGKEEWAIHQLNSTANFATSSRTLFWLLGGLNFQIEHHLFPRISHIHYPEISRFVREACAESNIVYHEYTSMMKAIVSHFIHLRKLGAA